LFAALNYLEGKLITRLAKRHRHQEWLAFLKTIDDQTPADLDIHAGVKDLSRMGRQGPRGTPAAGVTVLTRNATGKIESVRLMHRPLPMVLAFSAELARRVGGELDPEPLIIRHDFTRSPQ
jgi:hypothetical protein